MNYISLKEFSKMAGISPQMLIYYRKGDDFPKPHYIAGKPVYVKEEAEKWVKPVSKTRGWPKGKKRNDKI